jgi:hypothetical protein
MLAVYDPDHVNTGDLFPYVGLLDNTTPEGCAYLERQIRFFQKKVDGLHAAGHPEQAAPAEALLQAISNLLHAPKEDSHDNGN